MTKDDIPLWMQELLARVQEQHPSAVIAGGAIRDLDNGFEPKDVDIFIHVSDFDKALDALGTLSGLDIEVTSTSRAFYAPLLKEVGMVADVAGFPLPVQIILTSWRGPITRRFDYGINRIAFDGVGITKDEAYLHDQANRVLTLYRQRKTPEGLKAAIERYARLTCEKFRGWGWAQV